MNLRNTLRNRTAHSEIARHIMKRHSTERNCPAGYEIAQRILSCTTRYETAQRVMNLRGAL